MHLKLNENIFLAWVYQCSCRPSWSPNGQCLLGALLSWARNPAGWHHALRQDDRQSGRQLQHLLLWDWWWKTRSTCSFCGPGTNCHWWGIITYYQTRVAYGIFRIWLLWKCNHKSHLNVNSLLIISNTRTWSCINNHRTTKILELFLTSDEPF